MASIQADTSWMMTGRDEVVVYTISADLYKSTTTYISTFDSDLNHIDFDCCLAIDPQPVDAISADGILSFITHS